MTTPHKPRCARCEKTDKELRVCPFCKLSLCFPCYETHKNYCIPKKPGRSGRRIIRKALNLALKTTKHKSRPTVLP